MIRGTSGTPLKLKHSRQLEEEIYNLRASPKSQILALLETAETLDDMDLPGLSLHELKGKRKGTWAVKVSGNWRVTFKLQKGDAFDVNYEDYH